MSLLEECDNCYICKYNTKVLDDTIKLLPNNICLNISKLAGCRKCEIIIEIHEILDEMETLKKKKRRNRELIWSLERKVSILYDKLEEVVNETADIYEDV